MWIFLSTAQISLQGVMAKKIGQEGGGIEENEQRPLFFDKCFTTRLCSLMHRYSPIQGEEGRAGAFAKHSYGPCKKNAPKMAAFF